MLRKANASFFIFLILLAAAASLRAAVVPPSGASVTLGQCYEWAKARSEDLKVRREDIAQSLARGRAVLGTALPQADWNLTDTWQDPRGVDKLEQKGFSGFVQKEQIESHFSVKQTLFSGFKEFSARSGFRKESERDALRLKRASLELYENTAAAFYAVLAHEINLRNTEAALKLAEDRVEDLQSFLRLGKSRDSEVFTALARAAALKAQREQLRALIVSARQELSFLTGQDLTRLALRDEIPNPPAVVPLDEALTRARARSDLEAQRRDVEARKFRVRYERGRYWPAADVTGRYYTRRATFLEAIDWDVMLSLRLPLYQGGSVAANVRAAESAHRQSAFLLEEMERRAFHAVRRLQGELSGAVKETKALEEAAEAAQKSYDALRKEYRLGLVTNLDVLQALDLLQSQRNARDSAALRAKLLFLQLNAATETLP